MQNYKNVIHVKAHRVSALKLRNWLSRSRTTSVKGAFTQEAELACNEIGLPHHIIGMSESLSLVNFIGELKRELAAASKVRNPNEMALIFKSATIEVEVVAEVEANGEGGLKFWVVEMTGGVSNKQGVTHKLSLELVPDKTVLLGPEATPSRLDA